MGREESGQLVKQVPGHPRPYLLALSPNRAQIAFPENNVVELWDLSSDSMVAEFVRAGGELIDAISESVAFSDDGQWLASGYGDGAIKVWNIQTRDEHELSGYAAGADSVAASPDGRWIASGHRDSTVRIWDTTSGEMVRTFKSENRELHSIEFSPDSRWVAAGGENHSPPEMTQIEIWDVTNGDEVATLTLAARRVEFLKFNSGGTILASGASNGTVTIWNWRQREVIATLSPANKAIAFAADDKWVATGGKDGALTYWGLPGGRVLERIPNLGWAYTASPDGHWLASTGWGNDFKLWNLDQAIEWERQHPATSGTWSINLSFDRRQRTFKGHTDFVSDVAFSPDNRFIASCSWDGLIKIWNILDGRELHTLHGHTSGVQSIAFSPNARYLYSTGFDGTLRVWDVLTGEALVSMVVGRHSDDWLAVAPNGLFDGRADAMHEVAWRIEQPSALMPLENYFNDYYYAGLLADELDGRRPQPVVDIAALLQIPGLRAGKRSDR